MLRLTSPPVLLIIVRLANFLRRSLSHQRRFARPEHNVGSQRHRTSWRSFFWTVL